jgi:hypothetical protein
VTAGQWLGVAVAGASIVCAALLGLGRAGRALANLTRRTR